MNNLLKEEMRKANTKIRKNTMPNTCRFSQNWTRFKATIKRYKVCSKLSTLDQGHQLKISRNHKRAWTHLDLYQKYLHRYRKDNTKWEERCKHLSYSFKRNKEGYLVRGSHTAKKDKVMIILDIKMKTIKIEEEVRGKTNIRQMTAKTKLEVKANSTWNPLREKWKIYKIRFNNWTIKSNKQTRFPSGSKLILKIWLPANPTPSFIKNWSPNPTLTSLHPDTITIMRPLFKPMNKKEWPGTKEKKYNKLREIKNININHK